MNKLYFDVSTWSPRKTSFVGYGLGAVLSAGLMTALLHGWKPGLPTPPSLERTRFTVAVLTGPKQAAQTAPSDSVATSDSVAPSAQVKAEPLTALQRENSLPSAVSAAPSADVGPELAKPDTVVVQPPARVSMPGGQLAVEDAPVGSDADPFAAGLEQVSIRIFVDEKGAVVRGGILRPGSDSIRDTLILRAAMSRTYTSNNKAVTENGKQVWQIDLVLNYGNSELLP